MPDCHSSTSSTDGFYPSLVEGRWMWCCVRCHEAIRELRLDEYGVLGAACFGC